MSFAYSASTFGSAVEFLKAKQFSNTSCSSAIYIATIKRP